MDVHHKSLVFFRPFLLQLSLSLCFVCVAAGFSEYEVTFACIFTGFAESRPWECRVFSFKIARTSQKSRVFPFTFAPSCRQSLVLCVFLHVLLICVRFCGYALQFVAGSS